MPYFSPRPKNILFGIFPLIFFLPPPSLQIKPCTRASLTITFTFAEKTPRLSLFPFSHLSLSFLPSPYMPLFLFSIILFVHSLFSHFLDILCFPPLCLHASLFSLQASLFFSSCSLFSLCLPLLSTSHPFISFPYMPSFSLFFLHVFLFFPICFPFPQSFMVI
ncbi:unnamed protein product [Acanthosepion pharaonis]|uniref:Uncharacterized protein n=1 Tax=Acanthosepion pharaonis TaxID=158019 RepID=A0A812E5K4_ACAPH|nr:unnamed protein product [Sepia pharaonis]